MGRGSADKAASAQNLLYGTRSRGAGPHREPQSEAEAVRFLIDCAPPLPESIDNYFGDSRYEDQKWLQIFTECALTEDSFTDTAVEEEIIEWIANGKGTFSVRNWAAPHDLGPDRSFALSEGTNMKRVINAFKSSDLPISRQTLLIATNRAALRLALARIIDSRPVDEYNWQEKSALRYLVAIGGDKDLPVKIPSELLA